VAQSIVHDNLSESPPFAKGLPFDTTLKRSKESQERRTRWMNGISNECCRSN
jgi:hypothetical protein